MMIHKIVSAATIAMATVPMIALTANMALADSEPSKITVFNQGGYVADYQVSYILEGKKKSVTTRKLRLGQKQTFKIPSGSNNIRVRGQVYTGLLWEPKRLIFEKTYSTAPSEVCFKTYGTTLAAKWDNQCSADF
jgi:cytolysin (calcineurin-like family phosphatase)